MGQPLPSTTPEYKKKVLLHNNIDPDQFDLTDDGDVVPRNVQQPAVDVSNEPVPASSIETKPQQSSAAGAFGRGALASTLPTLGGLGAAGLASIALIPETGGLSLLGLLGVGASGLAGSMAAGKAQDAVLPDAAKQQLAEDQAEHPVASTVGGLAPSALLFNPVKGIMNLPDVGKAAYTGVTRGFKTLEAPAEQLLKNTAVNVGMNVGSGIAQQGINGQPIDAKGLGVDALSGLLFNEPTSIGKKVLPYLGHAQPPEQQPQVAQEQQGQAPTIEVKPMGTPNIRTGDETKDVSAFVRDDALNPEGKDFPKQKQRDAMHNFRESVDTEDQQAQMEAEGGGVITRPSKAETDAHKEEIAKQSAEQAESSSSQQPEQHKLTYEPQDLVSKRLNEQSMFPDINDVDRARNTREQQEALRDSQDEVLQEQIRQAKLQKEELQRQNDLKEQENLAAAKASAPSLVQGIDVGSADFNKRKQVNQDIQTIRVKPENPKLAIMRDESKSKLTGDDRFQEDPADNDPYLLRNSTPAYKQAVMELAAKRGISLREAKGLINPATGKEVLGKAEIGKRVASVNPNRAELDTPVHETQHIYLNDLLNSADPQDRKLAQRGIDIFGGDMNHAEEALTTRIGVDGANRIQESLDGHALRQFTSWFNDFKSRMKVNLGVANDEDVVRHLGARLQHDAPYGTREELGAKYTGFQPGFGAVEGRKLYTTKDEVKDENGNVKIAKGSTVGSDRLAKEGVKFQSSKDELFDDNKKALTDWWHLHHKDAAEEKYIQFWKEHSPDAFDAHVKDGLKERSAADEVANNFLESSASNAKMPVNEFYKKVHDSVMDDFKYQNESSNIKDNPNFKKWFGESKVVDKEGNPVTLYHGTTGDFTKVDKSMLSADSLFGPGFYMTDSKHVAGGDTGYAYKGALSGRETLMDERLYDHASSLKDNIKRVKAGLAKGGYKPEEIDEFHYIPSKDGRMIEVHSDMNGTPNVIPLHANIEHPFDMDKQVLEHPLIDKVTAAEHQQMRQKVDVSSEEGHALREHVFNNPPPLLTELLKGIRPESHLHSKIIDEWRYVADHVLEYDDRDRPFINNRSYREFYKDILTDHFPKYKITEALQNLGYDGITHTGGVNKGNPHKVWIAFDPVKVKSAIGNKGTYDPSNPDIRYQEESAAHDRMVKHEDNAVSKRFEEQGFRGEYKADATKNWRKDTALMRNLKEAGYSTDISMNDMQTVITKNGKTIDPDTLPSHLIEPAKAWLKRNGEYYGLDEETTAKLKEEREDAVVHELIKMGVDGREATDAMHDWSLVRDYVKQKDPKFNQWVEDNLFEGMDFGDKYQNESSKVNLGSRNQEILNKRKQPSNSDEYSFGPTRTLIDSVKRGNGPEGKALGDAATKALEEKQTIRAKHMAPIDEAWGKLSTDEQNQLHENLIQENRTKQANTDELNEKQMEAYEAFKKSSRMKQEDQIADNQPVMGEDGKARLPQIDEHYYPNAISPLVRSVLTKDPNSDASKNLMKDFIKHQIDMGSNKTVAESKLNALMTSFSPSSKLGIGDQHGASAYFKAVREAQGLGLPDSWMRGGNPLKDLNSYFTKVANDRAFYRNIESNPDIAKSIGLTKDAWGKDIESESSRLGGKNVHALLEQFTGAHGSEDESNVKAVNRVATSLMLGPLTSAHIMISSLAQAAASFTGKDFTQGMTHALTHFSDSYANALKTGYAKKNYGKINDVLDRTNTFAERVGSLANTLSKFSGRDLVDHVTKGLLQGAGEFNVNSWLDKASQGDKESIRKLKQLDPTVKDWSNPAEFDTERRQQLASTFASMIHGAHDARTLPRMMLQDSEIQPFMALASWNVAQTNHFMRNIFTPATKGNIEPLVMATLGASIGGYVLKELREKLADKKSGIPSFLEIAKSSKGLSGNIPLVAYNLMAQASMAGYGGVLSMLGKTGFDVAYKNAPQGYSFPLDEVTTGIGNVGINAAQALMHAKSMDEYLDIAKHASIDLARETVQSARLAHSWAVEIPGVSDEQARNKHVTEKNKELRKFKMVEGMPYEAQSGQEGNPYMDLPYKGFKKTQNLGEAAQEIPGLVKRAMEKANGNVEVLRSELQKIKANQYETMPSPERMPITFIKYLHFLEQTEGIDAAHERLMDYMKNNAINKAKSRMVPSF